MKNDYIEFNCNRSEDTISFFADGNEVFINVSDRDGNGPQICLSMDVAISIADYLITAYMKENEK